MAYFKIIPQHLPEGTTESHEEASVWDESRTIEFQNTKQGANTRPRCSVLIFLLCEQKLCHKDPSVTG